jgi:hypothetical protein
MNRTEASMLLMFIARVDNRNVDREVVEVWADMLDDIAVEDALPAAREHLRGDTRWLTPAILRQRVEDAEGAGPQRQSVAEAQRVPDADPDDPDAYREALRGRRYQAPAIPAPRPAGMLTAGGAR